MLKRITRRIEHQAAMFGRGADKWLDKPLAVFFPYAAFALIGSFHMARLVVRAAEMYGEQNGEQTGIKIGRVQGTKIGRLMQYLESAAYNGWSLADDVFAAILEAKNGGYWPEGFDEVYPGLLDEPFDCSYFVKRHNPNMKGRVGAPVADDDHNGQQARAYDRTAERARRALRLNDDPFGEYRKTILRPVDGQDELNDVLHGEMTLQVVDAGEVDDVQDAQLVDEGQAEETAEV